LESARPLFGAIRYGGIALLEANEKGRRPVRAAALFCGPRGFAQY